MSTIGFNNSGSSNSLVNLARCCLNSTSTIASCYQTRSQTNKSAHLFSLLPHLQLKLQNQLGCGGTHLQSQNTQNTGGRGKHISGLEASLVHRDLQDSQKLHRETVLGKKKAKSQATHFGFGRPPAVLSALYDCWKILRTG